ncbi:MAG: hypothetical protein G01um101418_8 [Parcubacteria group bacterium Gr01-1014_18]|nr:MAG: hypothetical protein Greene041636_8 [Parcubacteria group bacterium Greene0416_36]TSC81514.1 MAG: hypothetical protein G01um101418_8 [Parcubacteria group bacterium Gr01-1014_18]TSC99675.1 MAG: hypothetical protein Greene101420_79 [Parcubacteria group bacterium Greene1014_20]TSD07126.1 MAG: hypothetical protein Greene07142_438 [Parcubacteria group bacterium Greene0714_2]
MGTLESLRRLKKDLENGLEMDFSWDEIMSLIGDMDDDDFCDVEDVAKAPTLKMMAFAKKLHSLRTQKIKQ